MNNCYSVKSVRDQYGYDFLQQALKRSLLQQSKKSEQLKLFNALDKKKASQTVVTTDDASFSFSKTVRDSDSDLLVYRSHDYI